MKLGFAKAVTSAINNRAFGLGVDSWITYMPNGTKNQFAAKYKMSTQLQRDYQQMLCYNKHQLKKTYLG